MDIAELRIYFLNIETVQVWTLPTEISFIKPLLADLFTFEVVDKIG